MEPILTKNAPAPIGPYSQALDTGCLLFCSGQLGVDPGSGDLVGDDIRSQTHAVFANIEAVLVAAGLRLCDVVKTTVYLTDMGDFAEMNEVYSEQFAEPFPARSTIGVAALPKGALVEIEVLATL
ncbi:MAG: RidA family protein [Propionibacteriaceae bacterium]|nr:RidA family protein [Propionibacteriaceae bacterium]